jgi:hypothetical protein
MIGRNKTNTTSPTTITTYSKSLLKATHPVIFYQKKWTKTTAKESSYLSNFWKEIYFESWKEVCHVEAEYIQSCIAHLQSTANDLKTISSNIPNPAAKAELQKASGSIDACLKQCLAALDKLGRPV